MSLPMCAAAKNVLPEHITVLVVALEEGREVAGRPAFAAEPACMPVADYFLPSCFWAMTGLSKAAEEFASVCPDSDSDDLKL